MFLRPGPSELRFVSSLFLRSAAIEAVQVPLTAITQLINAGWCKLRLSVWGENIFSLSPCFALLRGGYSRSWPNPILQEVSALGCRVCFPFQGLAIRTRALMTQTRTCALTSLRREWPVLFFRTQETMFGFVSHYETHSSTQAAGNCKVAFVALECICMTTPFVFMPPILFETVKNHCGFVLFLDPICGNCKCKKLTVFFNGAWANKTFGAV